LKKCPADRNRIHSGVIVEKPVLFFDKDILEALGDFAGFCLEAPHAIVGKERMEKGSVAILHNE
jgi:hypothetical protein